MSTNDEALQMNFKESTFYFLAIFLTLENIKKSKIELNVVFLGHDKMVKFN